MIVSGYVGQIARAAGIDERHVEIGIRVYHAWAAARMVGKAVKLRMARRTAVAGVSGSAPNRTSRAARREAMRREGTPTSRSATSQSGSGNRRQYVTEGADGKPRVQTQYPPDADHANPHWHDAPPKVDRQGKPRPNNHGGVRYQSGGSSVQ
jgi:hypothetical protein